jgi:hypothetical protein
MMSWVVAPQWAYSPQPLSQAFDNSRTWLTYGTANPSLNVISDWGRRRVQTAPPNAPLVGLSDGTYYADLGTNPSTDGWALEVWADPTQFAGGLAVPFINIGPYFSGAIPVPLGALGTPVLELLPTDPTFSFLVPNIPIVLDPIDAIGRTPFIPQPAPLPGLVGLYLGFEAAVVAPGLAALTTTQARWVEIVR